MPLTLALIVGLVVSMLMPLTVKLALLPALSVTVPVAVWLAPPAARVTSAGQVAMPAPASEQVKRIVTAPLYQPLAFAAVVAAPLMVGLVVSILMPLTVALAVLPALSPTDWLALPLSPSPLIVLLAGQAPSMPESASPHVHLIVTAPLYQP